MAKTAVIIAEKYSPECIDINSGCPMAKITKNGAGSALMTDIPLLYRIVKAVNDAMAPYKIPVTLKIRSGFTADKLNWKEAASAAIDAGVKMLTIPVPARRCIRARPIGTFLLSWFNLQSLIKFRFSDREIYFRLRMPKKCLKKQAVPA